MKSEKGEITPFKKNYIGGECGPIPTLYFEMSKPFFDRKMYGRFIDSIEQRPGYVNRDIMCRVS